MDHVLYCRAVLTVSLHRSLESLQSPWMCPCSSPSFSTLVLFFDEVSFVHTKGAIVMTPLAQMDCCTMLGITPKTLHNWLRHANMQFSPHPTDARLKCLL